MTAYLYLHGFASSPASTKAQYFRALWQTWGWNLVIPDLNQPDFAHFTLSRAIQQITEGITDAGDPEVILVGSSLGGLVASWVAESCPQVHALVLLAPAFEFAAQWWPRLNPSEQRAWQETGWRWVHHYGYGDPQPLHYGFVEDLRRYQDDHLRRPLPTLILHGQWDDTIPLSASQAYAQSRPWVQLLSLPSDHALTDVLPEIGQQVQRFLTTVG
ncbi:MAG: alpha/beta fold hydrolase [Synechococcales cyanobacterium]